MEPYEKKIEKIKVQIEEFEFEKEGLIQRDDFSEKNDKEIYKIEQKIKKFKEEMGDIYEENIGYRSPEELDEDMLDMMFPDRHDDDFDEDSMSYDSVFGR